MERNDQVEITVKDVWEARKRLEPIVEKTPLIYSYPLSKLTNTPIYLKLENMHETGSFKIRGAANKILSLSESQQKKGVATFSTGNHGIAVAYVAKKLGIPATVCISNRVPEVKVNRLRDLGARVEVVGEGQDDAAAYCGELEKKEGITTIKPFDDLEVIAGQATIGLEIMADCPSVNQVVIPLSGGGLLSGIGFFLKNMNPGIKVTGMTMEQSAVMHHSIKEGKPITMKETDTLADSLLGGIGLDNRYTFSMTKKYMDDSLLVSEKAIAKGMIFMINYHKMVVEGAAATSIGWLLKTKKSVRKGPIVFIVSGSNVDSATVRRVMENH
ncbi:hydroxyectoine utilization dehydratase EutB [Aquibacillus albus]|uniref:Threonine dehydratase n=1 Tax=Aquibacillus albus TaxID=1168171 RepID=A0ABS2N3A6_9BACI|nr:hydroxyectoine utilization dehydratase EutB [Aquibacillus albus]MBM7572597.1 threonine dehydratase [Aquibacillus albus]